MSESTRLGISITASDTATASIAQLQGQIRALQQAIRDTGTGAANASGQITAAFQAEIDAIQREIAARTGQVTAIKAVTAAIREQGEAAAVAHRTLQQGIDRSFGVGNDRAIKSAAESARVLATSLSAAAEADARLRAEQLATAEASNIATLALERQGNAVRTLTGAQFFSLVERQAGIGRPALSAADSARAFQSQLGPVGTGVSSVSTQARINELQGINREVLSAAASAAVFQRELGAIGSGITSVGTKATIDTLQGINREMLSAAESAAVFQRALGAAGTGITSVATRAAIDSLHGINREMLSARDSAVVFSRELGTIGSAVTTVPSAGFSRMVADLAGVKSSYLSAADSARAFEAAGLTATEVALGIAAATSGRGIVAAATPALAASTAAARTITSGGTSEAAGAAGAAAAAAQLERQAVALRAVEAAERAAAAAGASQGEITAAGARAATLALREQEAAARGAGLASAASSRDISSVALGRAVTVFDELARGQRGALFSTIGRTAREAGLGVGVLATSVTGLIAVMAGLSIARHAEELGAWATQLKASASAAGISVGQYSALQTSLGLMGLKADEADRQLERLSRSAATANSQPASKMAEAFRNLGISTAQLRTEGSTTEGALRLLADAFQQTQDSENKTANFTEILGERWNRLIPLLAGGSSGLSQWIAQAQRSGAVNAEQAAQLEEIGRAVEAVSRSITSGAIPAFIAWGPAIKEAAGAIRDIVSDISKAITAIGELVSALNSVKIPDYGAILGKATHDFFTTSSAAGVAASRAAGSPVVDPRTAGSDAAKAAAERGGTVGATPAARPGVASDAASSNYGTYGGAAVAQRAVPPLMPVHSGGGKGAERQATEDFLSQEREKIAAADGSSQKIAAIYDEMLAALGTKYKASAALIAQVERQKIEAVNRARLDEIREGARQEEQGTRLQGLNAQISSIAAGKFQFAGQEKSVGPSQDIARSQEALQEAALVKQRAETEIASLKQIASTSEAGSNTQKAAEQEILSVTIQAKQRELELYKQAGAAAVEAANKIAQPFKSFFDSVGSQAQTFTDGILKALIAPQTDLIKAGLTTIKFSEQGNEMRAAARSLMLGIVNDFANNLESALGHVVANALSGGAANTIGDLLSQTLGKAVSSITGNAAGTALGNVAGSAAGQAAGTTAGTAAITTAITAATTAQTGASTALDATITAALTASTTSIVAAITAASAEEDVLLAGINVKPSALGFTYAHGGIVPSAAGGMVVGGTGGTLAILHAQEMVLPAPISRGVQDMIARGNQGGNTTNNNTSINSSPTINTGSRGRGGTGMTRGELTQALALHSGSLLGEARNMIRNGWRPA